MPAKFDANSGNYMEAATSSVANVTGTTFSAHMWVKMFATGTRILVKEATGHDQYLVDHTGTVFRLGIGADTGGQDILNGNLVPKLNRWYSLGVRKNGTAGTSFWIFVDGVIDASGTSTRTIASTTAKLRFGADASLQGTNLSGLLAHAAIWNVALTDDQFHLLAQGYDPRLFQRSGLVGYWPLDERHFTQDVALGNPMTVVGSVPMSTEPVPPVETVRRNRAGIWLPVKDRLTKSGVGAAPFTVAGNNEGVTAYEEVVKADNPKAYWPLLDPSGNPIDVSGNALPMTSTTGSPTYQQSAPTNLGFGVTYPAGAFASRSQVTSFTNGMTMELWAYFNSLPSSGQPSIIENNNGGTNGWSLSVTTSGTIQAVAQNIALLNPSNTVFTTGRWYHIVCVRDNADSNRWKYYVNGAIDNANAGNSGPSTPSGATTRFGSTTATGMSVVIAHAAIYESVLSPTRVAAHYAAAYAPDKTGSGVAPFTAAGARTVTSSKTGAGVSSFAAAGVNEWTLNKSGAGVAPFTGGGRTGATSKTATADTAFTASGVKSMTFTKEGAAKLDAFIASGADVPTQQNSGAGVSERKASGVKQTTLSKKNAGISPRVGSGAKLHELLRTTTSVMPHAGSGASGFARDAVFTSPTLNDVYPLITLTGACYEPKVRNNLTGEWVQLRGLTLDEGEALVLDHNNQTATVNGHAVIGLSGRFFSVRSYADLRVSAAFIGTGFSAFAIVPGTVAPKTRAFSGGGVSERSALGRPSFTGSRFGAGVIDLSVGGALPLDVDKEGAGVSTLVGVGSKVVA